MLSPGHITLQAWVRIDYFRTPYLGVVTKRNCCGGNVEQWTMQTEGSGFMHFHATTDSIGIFITDQTQMQLGVWTHFTATYDGHTANLYRNGVLARSDTTPRGNITPKSFPVVIGDRDGGNDWWPGDIDEVRIWNRALSRQEILDNMSCHLSGSENGLIAYYDFNQGIPGGNNASVTVLPDLTSNHLDGVLQNFSLYGNTSNWITSFVKDSLVSILSQPASLTLYTGDTARFIVSSSNGMATFQWQVDSGFGFVNLLDTLQFSGSTHDALTVNNVTTANNTLRLRCIVSSPGYCHVTSLNALLTVYSRYVFIGVGNWNINTNWSGNIIPPALLPANSEILINPPGSSECILNVGQTILPGGKITVLPGKKLRIVGDLRLE